MKAARLLALLACQLTADPSAAANLVTFELTAQVISVTDPQGLLGGDIQASDTLTATLQYDLDLNATDVDPSPNSSSRFAEQLDDSFLQGTNGASRHFRTTKSFNANIINDARDGDYLYFFVSGDTNPSTLSISGVNAVNVDFFLYDSDGTALTDDLLPATLDLAAFDSANLFFSAAGSDPLVPVYDVFAMVTNLTLLLSEEQVSGDFNRDGAVDAADYTVWRDGLGVTHDSDDYLDWRSSYGAGTLAAGAAPTPAAISLLAVMAAALSGRRRRG